MLMRSLVILSLLLIQIPLIAGEKNWDFVASSFAIKRKLEHSHLEARKFDDEVSRKIFDIFLDRLDPNRFYFNRSDIEELLVFRDTIDDELRKQGFDFPRNAINIWVNRKIQYAQFAKDFLKKHPDAEEYTLNSQFQNHSKTNPQIWRSSQDYLNRWRDSLVNEVINLRLQNKTNKEIFSKLEKKFEKLENDALKTVVAKEVSKYLSSISLAFDPHSTFYSPQNRGQFEIEMKAELVGVGVVISKVGEGKVVVNEIIESGPVEMSKSVNIGDEIVSITARKNKKVQKIEIKDSSSLQDVSGLLRGTEGSKVIIEFFNRKLQESKVVELTRKKIKIMRDHPTYKIIVDERGVNPVKIGVLSIPAYNSVTTSVSREHIIEMKKQGVDGIVVDLLDNGGGYIWEAVKLSGLFVERAVVVRKASRSLGIQGYMDNDPKALYTGPVAVLVNSRSASASEITAGFIKDYKRGIIIGQRTFGKGTVQEMYSLNKAIQNYPDDVGSLKFTASSFHRPNGKSTQFHGVKPDIGFSLGMHNKRIGERFLKNPLVVREIEDNTLFMGEGYKLVDSSVFPALQQSSTIRVHTNPVFDAYVKELTYLEEINEDEVSLNFEERKIQYEENLLKVYGVQNAYWTSAGRPDLDFDKFEGMERQISQVISYQRRKAQVEEAGNILADYINLTTDKQPVDDSKEIDEFFEEFHF
jgi:carboxyl-terminal processing protease